MIILERLGDVAADAEVPEGTACPCSLPPHAQLSLLSALWLLGKAAAPGPPTELVVDPLR